MKTPIRSWTEKLDYPVEARIVKATGNYADKFGKGNMVIPTPRLIEAIIRKVPKGKLTTIHHIREKLAEDFGVDYACPLTTGIFTWICSNAAEEARKKGVRNIIPWWRVVKDDGGLNPKAPGGEEYHAKLLKEEGYRLVRKSLRSQKLVVKDAEHHMMKFTAVPAMIL